MTVLSSAIDTRSEAFKKNAEAMRGLVADLRARTDKVRLGGGEESRKRHVARGKMLVRDRLKAAGFGPQAGRKLILTGGASQLTGDGAICATSALRTYTKPLPQGDRSHFCPPQVRMSMSPWLTSSWHAPNPWMASTTK